MTPGINYQAELQKVTASTGGFRIEQAKQKEYAITLDAKLNEVTTPPTWEALKEAIFDTGTQIFGEISQVRKTMAKGLPCKKWYDDECNRLRKELKHISKEDLHRHKKNNTMLLHGRRKCNTFWRRRNLMYLPSSRILGKDGKRSIAQRKR